MKKVTVLICLFSLISILVTNKVYADGCYICRGGSYVKFKGDDSEEKRKDASKCGCRVVGTQNPCDEKKVKILCAIVQYRLLQSVQGHPIPKCQSHLHFSNVCHRLSTKQLTAGNVRKSVAGSWP